LPPRAGRAVGAEFARAWHEAESSKILKPAIAALRRTHLDPAWYCAVGNPGVEIADWADRHAIDLIVMGSHGRSALKGLVFGSVTQRVLASTAVPVLVLRTPKAPIRASLRVAIALDGSAYGEEAAQYVVRHHGLFGPRPKFALIHVHAPSLLGSSPRALPTASDLARVEAEAFEQALAPARELFAKEGLSATEHRIVGHPGEEIARFARAEKLDILVMGSHGRGALTAALLGSVACQVHDTVVADPRARERLKSVARAASLCHTEPAICGRQRWGFASLPESQCGIARSSEGRLTKVNPSAHQACDALHHDRRHQRAGRGDVQ
jgi:nucleotide-binding universal stress UspA family protein